MQSQRYVKENDFEFVVPPEIEAVPEAKRVFEQSMEDAISSYRKLADLLADKHYKAFLAQGIDEKMAKRNAEKKAIEDARFVLPNACDTKMIATFNARSLYNFFGTVAVTVLSGKLRQLPMRCSGLFWKWHQHYSPIVAPPVYLVHARKERCLVAG